MGQMAFCSTTYALYLCSLSQLHCRVSPSAEFPLLPLYLPQKPFLSSPPSLRFSFKRFPPLAPPRFYEAKAPVLELDPGPGPEPENPQIVETAAEMPMQEAVFAVVMVSILILKYSSVAVCRQLLPEDYGL